jgi:acetylglutamate kinase
LSRLVIKLGGSVLSEAGLRSGIIPQLTALQRDGHELIIVHGGGKQIAQLLDRLGIESRFYEGLRVTDVKTRDVAQMVLAGKVGKDLVASLAQNGTIAVSIAGGDALSFQAQPMVVNGADLGYVGSVTTIRSKLVDVLLGAGIVPVVACLALGADDFEYYNVNGDQMAAAVAAGCRADVAAFVTDVGSVFDADRRPMPVLHKPDIDQLLESGVACGGMRPKLRACLQALAGGVKQVLIVGAAEANGLSRAIGGEPIGTRIS